MKSAHKEINRLIVMGKKPAEVADRLGVTVDTVRRVMNGRGLVSGQDVIEHRKDLESRRDESAVQVRDHLQDLSPGAARVLGAVLEDEGAPLSLRMRAAQDVLDRTGHTPVRKISGGVTHLQLGLEELLRMKKAAGVDD